MAQEAQVSFPSALAPAAEFCVDNRAASRDGHRVPFHAPAQQLIACFRYEMGRQAANTKLSTNVAVRRVRVRGGNFKFRALRLDAGNFSWGSEAVTRKTRLLDVVYNASNNELVSRLWNSEEILMSGSQRNSSGA